MPCKSSTVCLLAQETLEGPIICFRSPAFPEWEGLRGMPTSTKASLPPAEKRKHKAQNIGSHQQSPAMESNQNPALGRHRHNSSQLQRRHLTFRLPQKLKMKSEEMTLIFLKIVKEERIKKGILYLEKITHNLGS